MNWLTLTLLCVFFVSIAPLLQRILLRGSESDERAFAILFQFANGLLIALVGFLFFDMTLPDLSPYLPNLIILALLYGLGNLFVFAALKRVEASIFTIVFACKPIFTLLSSTLILKEGLEPFQLTGLVLIIFAITIASINHGFKIRFSRGELFALIAAVLFGFEVTNDRILLKSLNVFPFMTIAYLIPAIIIALSYPSWYKKASVFLSKKNIFVFLVLIVTHVLASITFFLALQTGYNSSQISAISQVSTVVTVLLAIVFLKENDRLVKKIIAAVFSAIGVILLK
ncbi:MAG: hypothetical protein UT63_C0009G0004 [Candidatus Gottesmanbacteria bacterium GW2011_GWC2_39_8]|uniref:EamA domain-containing protein n=1 Tax=Candidatus Gottesmanbacteria bacterium GW2011_GWC2_39_8 TaxID=1618450 RepID=A0A0G0Q0U9_9BACT|nr:MAG: hypothetical protein UT63_C0009G0004 [Candidatus Gottesmanbacteria bacterium GW2011_GWC2_39_8]